MGSCAPGFSMKLFIVLAFFVCYGISIVPCEERIRRQIWGPPPNRNPLWEDNSPDYGGDDFGRNEMNSWMEPNSFSQPSRNNFGDIRGDGFGDYDNFRWSRDDSSGFDRNNRNQNRRKKGKKNQRQNQIPRTTRDPRPLTTTPRTIHVAPQGCTCPMTQQFNPVCGTDGNTYRNKGLLNCYQRCGNQVAEKRLGAC